MAARLSLRRTVMSELSPEVRRRRTFGITSHPHIGH